MVNILSAKYGGSHHPGADVAISDRDGSSSGEAGNQSTRLEAQRRQAQLNPPRQSKQLLRFGGIPCIDERLLTSCAKAPSDLTAATATATATPSSAPSPMSAAV